MSKEFRNNIKKLRTEIDNADAIVIGSEAYCPIDIENQSICIDGDIDEILDMLK